MKNLPSLLVSLQKSHLIVRLSTFQICQNICFKVRLFPVFLMECKFSELFFPMNTDASNVEDINILQIIECLSISCITSVHSPCARMIWISTTGLIL